jgi:hypothetical protein
MGRPRVSPAKRKRRRFTIYVDDAQAARIRRAATAYGHLEPAEWIRGLILAQAAAVTGMGRL